MRACGMPSETRRPGGGRFSIDNRDRYSDYSGPLLVDDGEILLQVLLQRVVKVRSQHLLVVRRYARVGSVPELHWLQQNLLVVASLHIGIDVHIGGLASAPG